MQGEGARAIGCPSCGAALPIKLDASAIGCSYCGAEHQVSEADRQRMQSAAAELRKTDALSNAAEAVRARPSSSAAARTSQRR